MAMATASRRRTLNSETDPQPQSRSAPALRPLCLPSVLLRQRSFGGPRFCVADGTATDAPKRVPPPTVQINFDGALLHVVNELFDFLDQFGRDIFVPVVL